LQLASALELGLDWRLPMAESESFFEPLDKTAAFGDTNWFKVRKAGSPEAPESDAARADLSQAYWYPIYFYVRRVGYSPEDAQDLTQEFFARVWHKNYLQSADHEKGKFRSFLLTILKRFLADEWDRAHREKRGGGQETISLDAQDTDFFHRSEPADEHTPEKAFERSCAKALMDEVLKQLGKECAAAGKGEVFQELRPFLTCEDKTPQADAAQKLNMTENNLKVTVHRLRQRYRELLRGEIQRTAGTPEQVEEEIRGLIAALA
jgi:RNA polymerase sigma factor (sigma-70 family)